MKHILEKYIRLSLFENIQNVHKLFIDAISISDEYGPKLLESLCTSSDVQDLIRTGECEDEYFTEVYQSILSKGFKLFAQGSGRLVFSHDNSPEVLYKLVIPNEDELDENLEETAREKSLSNNSNSSDVVAKSIIISSGNSELDSYFNIVEKVLRLFDENWICVLEKELLHELRSQLPKIKGNDNRFCDIIKERLIKYYQYLQGDIDYPEEEDDILSEFFNKIIELDINEPKPDNVGLKRNSLGKLRFIMLDV